MNWEGFKDSVTILPDSESAEWRQRYIAAFIDTSSSFYQERIASVFQFKDGPAYDGYLWDCLQGYQQISKEELNRRLLMHEIVMVFWDIHSAERIRVPNYWRFPKAAVLRLQSNALEAAFEYLPEDIYIFDHSVTWTLITTHEYNNSSSLIYLASEIEKA